MSPCHVLFKTVRKFTIALVWKRLVLHTGTMYFSPPFLEMAKTWSTHGPSNWFFLNLNQCAQGCSMPNFGKLPMVQTREICTREIGSVRKNWFTLLCTCSQCSQNVYFFACPDWNHKIMLFVEYNYIIYSFIVNLVNPNTMSIVTYISKELSDQTYLWSLIANGR